MNEKELPAQFNIKSVSSEDIIPYIAVGTSIRLAEMRTALEVSILQVPGVDHILLTGRGHLFTIYKFSVDISKTYNPERIALSLAKTVIDTAVEDGQVNADATISFIYNSKEQNFDSVDALSVAIDTIEQRANHVDAVNAIDEAKKLGVEPKSEPIPQDECGDHIDRVLDTSMFAVRHNGG